LGEKVLPFYALMKKSDDKFKWTEEADIAFAQLKNVLSTPPVLVAPNEKEPLLLYIAATHQVVSTILVVERSEEGKAHRVQRPVYFLSEVLSPTKQRYPHYQKLAYNIFTTTQKLWQYFTVHPIIGVNKAPLSNILNECGFGTHLGRYSPTECRWICFKMERSSWPVLTASHARMQAYLIRELIIALRHGGSH
jgi:dsDNA-binding SOS-regulon protein